MEKALLVIVVFANILFFTGCKKECIRFEATTEAMIPTINKGDIVTVEKLNNSQPVKLKRWDLVAFIHPDYSDKPNIRRIVGLPGEDIVVLDNKIMINNKPLKSPAELQHFYQTGMLLPYGPKFYLDPNNPVCHIPDGAFFLLGDNVITSMDSRHFGPIFYKNIIGRVIKINDTLVDMVNQPGRADVP